MATNPNVTHFPIPTPAATPFEGRPLAQKLALILANIDRVPKNGRNDFHNYDYVYESDLVDHIRDKLAEQGVAIFPSVREHNVQEMQDARNKSVFLTTVTLDVTLIDGQSGDQITTTWVGQGLDNGDKGYYKAYTGAIKYFILKTFMISTGDDPEQDDAPRPTQGTHKAPQAKAPRAANTDTDDQSDRREAYATEFRALLEESVDDEAVCDAFQALYLSRMGASKMDEIDAHKLGAMCRRLRSMNVEARQRYIEGVLEDNANETK